MKQPWSYALIAAAALAALVFGVGVDTARDGRPQDVLAAAQSLSGLN
ncbi:hypothetical protein [Phenylobacterium zucineum]|nr:hypothetical protein [Phenylobacterium zucineum]